MRTCSERRSQIMETNTFDLVRELMGRDMSSILQHRYWRELDM